MGERKEQQPEPHTIRPETANLGRQAEPLGDGFDRYILNRPIAKLRMSARATTDTTRPNIPLPDELKMRIYWSAYDFAANQILRLFNTDGSLRRPLPKWAEELLDEF